MCADQILHSIAERKDYYMEKNLNNLITVINSYGYNIEQGKPICCPVHGEDTASFFINTGADGEAYWK